MLHCGAVVLAILAHAAATAGVLVFDDVHAVAANPALRDPANWWRWLSDPTAFSESGAMYRPVVLLSLGLGFLIDGGPFVFKAGNVLLHALVVFLAFGWLRRLGASTWTAFTVMALFAVHPLLTEAVNLVSARSELLLCAGLLIALRSHLEFGRGAASPAAIAGVLCGAAVACGSKETGVVLPALMISQSLFVNRSGLRGIEWRRVAVTVLPAVALVLGYLVLRKVLLGEATVSLGGRTGDDPLSGHGRSIVTQLSTMGLLLPRALLAMVFPVGLTLDPQVTFRHGFASPDVLAGWGAIALLIGLALLPGPGAGPRRLGAAIAGAAALPWIVIPLNVPLAEHRLYVPLLGVLLCVAPWLPRPRTRPVAFAGLVALGIVLSTLRALDFRDPVALWRAEVEHAATWRAWWGLGAVHLRAGDCAAALEPLAEAHLRNDNHPRVLRNYAEAVAQLPDERARPGRALAVTDRYLATRPDDPWARALSAQAHLQAGRVLGDRHWFEAAERVALSCLDVAEPKGFVFRLAAAARVGMGDHEGALAHLDRSLALGLDHVSVRLARADVLGSLGRHAEARSELMRAQRQAPTDPHVIHALRAAAPR